MQKLKLMTVLGTRPEIIRLSEIIKTCDRYFDHRLVHTGQNWDYRLNGIFFEDLNLRQPDIHLDVAGKDLGESLGNIIARSYACMLEERPDALLVLGDTNSALSAIAAKRLKIPIFHMEAGNRCFDENLPEETNRRIVDHIADVNLCYSENARRYLLMEGCPKDRSMVVGSPMAEVLAANRSRIEASGVLKTCGLEKGRYILLSAHREENIDIEKNFTALTEAVNTMAEHYRMPVVYSMHPRSKNRIEARNFTFHPLVRALEPFGFSDYNALQANAFCVVSDSGTLPEESAYFRSFPAVCIRSSTERPEALESGNFILAGIETKGLLQAIDLAVAMQTNKDLGAYVPDYCADNVSTKVVKIIQSYTSVINTVVWRKD